ncbi:MAG: sulfatase [Verrucomicrobia bacterium]|nr:sulfatase [Verrucomicrobiota bacterium]
MKPLRVLCALWLGLLMSVRAAEAPRPNIIFIMVDDMGWRELGCYGNTFNETPHLDQMAKAGMKFTQAYAAAPVCSPTRAALMTGQWPARLRITDYLGPQEKEKFLKPGTPVLSQLLKTQGYVSGLVGKWHLTGDYTLNRGEPQKHGWDEVICSETTYIGPGYYFPPYKHMPEEKVLPGKEYLTDRLNHEAVEFIKRNQRKPFFLYLSHYAPHTRLVGKPELVEKYRQKPGAGTERNNPQLAAMMETIDQGVGGIVRTLKELKLEENTLIIFTSDNGGEATRGQGKGITSVEPLRGGKSQLYEGGIRVSLLAHWPKGIRAGSECAVPVSTLDFFPTLLELTGGKVPDAKLQDGVSLAGLLRGEAKLTRQTLYWHYPLAQPHFLGGRSAGAIREGDFKLVEFYDTKEVEMYDLSKDISEQHNLAPAQPEKAAELKRKLMAWRESVNAEMIAPLPPTEAKGKKAAE